MTDANIKHSAPHDLEAHKRRAFKLAAPPLPTAETETEVESEVQGGDDYDPSYFLSLQTIQYAPPCQPRSATPSRLHEKQRHSSASRYALTRLSLTSLPPVA
jgi:hypothetical protein